MKICHLFLSACAMALSAGAAAHAQDAPSANIDASVDALVVTVTRAPLRLDHVGSSVTVLDEKAIQASQAVVVSDLLARTPGVTFSRNGGVGEPTAINIRGAETDQTVFLIDGVKLNDPGSTGGGFNAANLLAGDIARIEVMRGPQSTLWGSQAIGGVVNVITRVPTRPLEMDANVEGGGLDTAYVKAGIGGKDDRLTWRLAGGYFTSEGVSAFAPGTERDGYRNYGASGRILFDLTDTVSLEARSVYSNGHNGFDATNADAPFTSDAKDLVVYGAINANLLDGRFKNRLSYAYTEADRQNLDPTQANTPVTFASTGTNERVEYQGTFEIKEGLTTVFGAEHELAEIQSASPTAAQPNPAPVHGDTDIDGVYAQLQARLAPGLTFTGGLRHDEDKTFGGHTIGQAAVAWSLDDDKTILRASYGQGFKAPTLFQLFSAFGNLNLEPERAESWDVGVEHHLLPNLLVSATYFNRVTDDQIEFAFCSVSNAANPLCAPPRVGFYSNVGKVTAQGAELGAGWSLGRFTTSANYTYLDETYDTAGSPNFGKQLARRPREAGNATLGYLWPIGLTTSVSVRYAGSSFNDAANTQRLAAYSVVDVLVSYPVNDHLEVYGRIENLFDKTYQTALNYGSVPLVAYCGVRLRF